MSENTFERTVEQNHKNLQRALEAVSSNYQMDVDPEVKGKRAAFFEPNKNADDVAEMSDEDRLAWMFEQNAEAIVALAQEIGVAERKLEGEVTSAVGKNAGFFAPEQSR